MKPWKKFVYARIKHKNIKKLQCIVTRVYCGQTAWTIELIFGTQLTHGNSNDVLGGAQIPLGTWVLAAKMGRGPHKLGQNMFEVQYLRNGALFGVGVNWSEDL